MIAWVHVGGPPAQANINKVTHITAAGTVLTNGHFDVAGDSDGYYANGAQIITAGRVLKDVTFDAALGLRSHNHSGADITSGTVGAGYLPVASDVVAGIVSTGAQTVAGDKTFTGAISTTDFWMTGDDEGGPAAKNLIAWVHVGGPPAQANINAITHLWPNGTIHTSGAFRRAWRLGRLLGGRIADHYCGALTQKRDD